MNASADLLSPLASGSPPATTDPILWHHASLCQFALPLRASAKTSWRREWDGAFLAIEAAEGVTLPTGRFARLLLMYLCDSVHRSGGTVVELGENIAAVARALGAEVKGARLREMEEQLARLLSTRITLAGDGAAALALFDARARSRGAPGWRSTARLNARFVASLAESAVALQRHIVLALLDSPLAMDLYAFIAAAQLRAQAATPVTAGWDELRERFGTASQSIPELRSTVEPALDLIRQLWPELPVEIGKNGIVVQVGAAPARPAVQAASPEPAAETEEAAAPPVMTPEPAPEPDPEPDPEPVVVTAVEAEAPPPPPSPAAPLTDQPFEDRLSRRQPPEDPSRRQSRQTVSLKSHLTGLPQVIWLQRSNGRDTPVIEVTPGGRYDPETRTVIALEPVTLQIAGGLYARDFERVAAWAAANRDLIDDWWDSRIDGFEEVSGRVRKVPAPTWR
ncbi:conserved protein of unknown function [Rhodovastum atsumiense]|uniref:Uncharacterized protein n=1 Tax=Rhodovastum atsumiense TaxID=504468 RepID=A0A5M6ILT4_9PROT|nr:replication protein RepA [Rhodovastum atsumiense]KAA5609241.1 hypothetical protein F1189_25015 [Rhodovastum atsumiense]CAH2601692.1 conserved protein of unknown function [Rhodovastum atsumiense]